MKRNLAYEAGFTRAVDDERSPEDIVRAKAVRNRRRLVVAAAAAIVVAGVAGAAFVQLRRDNPVKQLARAKLDIAAGKHAAAIIELKRSLQGSPVQPEARFLLGNELWFYGDAKNAEIEYQKALASGLPAQTGLVPMLRAALAQHEYDQVVSAVNAATLDSPESNAELQTMLGTAYIGLGKTDSGMEALASAKDFVPNFTGALIAESRHLLTQGKFDAAAAALGPVPDADKQHADLQTLKGDIAYGLRKPDEAVVAYQAALQQDPNNQGVGMRLAEIYLDLGKLDLGRQQIALVTKANPKNARAQYIRAAIAYQLHDLPTTSDAITQSVQLSPTDGKAQLLAGVVAMEQGQLVGAEPHLSAALRLLSPNLEARKALVNLYLQRQELTQASDALQPALTSAADGETIALAIKVALLQGDQVKASNLFEQTAARQATDVKTGLVGAAMLFAAGKPDAGLARLNATGRANPASPEVDTAAVVAQLELHRNDAAYAAWQGLERKRPNSPETYELLGRIAMARGDMAAARKAWEKAVTIEPMYFAATADLVALDVQAQQLDPARARLRQAIAADAKSVEAPLLLARVEEGPGGDPSKIAELLATARTRDPAAMPAVWDSIGYYSRRGDAAAALAVAQDALKLNPNNQPLLSAVSDLLLSTGPKERALPTLTRLTALNNENPDYAVRLGMSQLAAGQTEPALNSFRNAYKRAPQRTDLQVATVEAFLAAGKSEEATRALFEVSQQAPRSPLLGELDADIKLASKQFPEALAAYRQALADTPSTRLAIKTYQAMIVAKQRTLANGVLAQWLASHPADVVMCLFDAQVATDAKDYGRAAADYRKVLETHPEDPAILNNLAWALDQLDDPKALAFAEKASRLAPDNADVADTFGGILVRQGQTGRGLDVMMQATSLAPGKLDIRLRLAKAQIKGDRKDAARSTLQKLLGEAPDSAEGKESRSLLSTL